MLMTEKERERQRQKRFKQEVREQELRKYWNPERDLWLARVWVIYIWIPSDVPGEGKWKLAGFRRKRQLRKRQTMNGFFAKIRRKLEVDKKVFVLVRDLDEASRRLRETDQSWQTTPPQYYQRKLRKKKIKAPVIPKRVKPPRRRATVKAYLFNKKTTKYVALGRFSWSRSPRYLYLGPLISKTRREARREAARIGACYNDLLVIEASELSKPLRAAMARSKRVRAGITRLVWPEVPPDFDHMWRKFATRLIKQELHGAVTLDDPRMIDVELALRAEWDYEENPWLTLSWFRKQIKPWRPQCDVPKKRKRKRKRATVVSRKASASSSRTTKLPPGKYAVSPRTLVLRLKSKLSLKSELRWRGKLSRGRSGFGFANGGKPVVITSRPSRGGPSGKHSKKTTIKVTARRKDVLTVQGSLRRQPR